MADTAPTALSGLCKAHESATACMALEAGFQKDQPRAFNLQLGRAGLVSLAGVRLAPGACAT